MGVAETARLTTQLDLDDRLTPGLNRASSAVSNFQRKMGADWGKVNKGVGEVGRGLARVGAIAAGVAAVGIAGAAKAAIDFEDAFAGVRKTVDEADLKRVGMSFEGLARDFRDMATEIPIAATEFARLGETAGALGVKAKDIKEFARVTALMGVTTNLSADEAADAFGRIGTILGLTGKEYSQLADTIVALGNAGASTESEITEITKRFAAEARAAGLAKEQIAAIASATASLGFAPERGGTALARVFGNLSTNISTANAKGKALSKEIGVPIKELQREIDQGRGLPIFLDVLKQIRDMKPTEAARFLKSIGVTNVSDRTIFRNMAENLPFVNEQLEIATKASGALSTEAEKRFDTVRSKFQLLKNAGIEAGITLGEGFAPALGRAATRLSTWIKQNKGELVGMGQEIGKAIDGINWGAVMGGLRTLVGLFKTGWDIIRQIPPEITAIGLALVGVNKLSGGLLGSGIGNVAGGLFGNMAKSLIAQRGGAAGRLVAQPVMVMNWPAGMVAGGAAGGGGVVAAGGRGGRLMRGAGVAGLGLMGAQMLLGDQIEGAVGEGVARGVGAASNIMAGAMFGPVGIAAASLLTAAAELKGLSDDIGKAQVANREAATKVGQNPIDASKNIANMVRLMQETTGLDRELLKTFSSGELGAGLQNATDALMMTINKNNQGSIIRQMVEAQSMAREYGWTKVADAIGVNLERARRWVPKPETFASAVAKGAATGAAAGIRRAEKDEGGGSKELSKAQWNVHRVVRRMEGMQERGNRLGLRHQERIFELMKRGLMADQRDMGALRRAIRMAEKEKERAESRGNRTLARNIGRDIDLMKRALRAEQQRTNTKLTTIAAKDTSVSVTVPVTTNVSIRDVQRTQNTSARYGMQAV